MHIFGGSSRSGEEEPQHITKTNPRSQPGSRPVQAGHPAGERGDCEDPVPAAGRKPMVLHLERDRRWRM